VPSDNSRSAILTRVFGFRIFPGLNPVRSLACATVIRGCNTSANSSEPRKPCSNKRPRPESAKPDLGTGGSRRNRRAAREDDWPELPRAEPTATGAGDEKREGEDVALAVDLPDADPPSRCLVRPDASTPANGLFFFRFGFGLSR
jgi:hypothetical protein